MTQTPAKAPPCTPAPLPEPSGLVTIANNVTGGETVPPAEAPGVPSRHPRVKRRHLGRRDRYDLRSVLWDVSSIDRVCGCGRWRRAGAEAVTVRARPDGSAYLDGIQTCGSVWACPVCSVKIRQRRANELRDGLGRHLDAGGGLAMQVLTLPHDAGDRLRATFETVQGGWRRVQQGRAWKRLRDELGIVGYVRATEVTHGPNGWHPHVHVLFLFDRPPSVPALARLESYVYAVWSRYVEGEGFRRPMQRWCHVEPVRRGRDVADYLAKITGESGWDVPLEMTRHDLKVGRDDETRKDHRTPWQILRTFEQTGDELELGLWLEYEQASKGKRAIGWSRGLKDRLGIVEQSDEDLAEEEQGGAVITHIAPSEWKALCSRPGAICRVLETAETGDPAEVLALIQAEVQQARAGP